MVHGWLHLQIVVAVAETSNVDIVIQAEGDIDGNGATSQLYTTDETRDNNKG